jgi:superfamily II DNA or RNA helicase
VTASFSELNVPREIFALGTSVPPTDLRQAALRRLQSGDLQILFAVDLFNEGLDIPAIDTVLLLRPTESATPR